METYLDDKPGMARVAIKWAGVITVYTMAVTLIQVYAFGNQNVMQSSANFFMILVNIAVFIIAGINWRKLNGGYSPFGEMFQFLLLTMVLYRLAVAFLNWLVFYVIDGGTGRSIAENYLYNIIEAYENAGMDDAMIETVETMFLKIYSLGFQIGIFIFMVIVYLVLAAILGAIIQKKESDFA